MYIRILTKDAIAYAGNKSKLANILEITRQSITSWGKELPQTSAQKLYIITQGEVGEVVNEDINRINKSSQSSSTTKRRSNLFYP